MVSSLRNCLVTNSHMTYDHNISEFFYRVKKRLKTGMEYDTICMRPTVIRRNCMPKNTYYHLTVEKQARIIKGAMKAFSAVPYRLVTIDQIVKLAEIPKGSFYQYFENKDDLFAYIFGELGDEKKEALESVSAQISNHCFEEFVPIVLSQAKSFENQDTVMIGLKNRFLRECPQEVKMEIMQGVIPKSYRLFESIVRAYCDKGEFRSDLSVKNAAYLITSAITQLEYYEFVENEDYEEIVKQLLHMVTIGFREEKA